MAILKAENVLDEWQEVLPAGADRADEYLKDVWKRVYDLGLPVDIGFEDAALGLVKSAMGQSRQFLVMNPQTKVLNTFRLLHFAFPVGNALTTGWFLAAYSRNLGTTTGLRVPLVHDLDLFTNADLMALLRAIHQWSVLPAFDALAASLQVDLSSINRKSKGLFGIG